MSMEERLALYKKKYGKRLEQGSSGQSGGDPRRRGRPGEERSADKVAAPPLGPAARSDQPKPETEAAIRNDKARGLFGKLQDFFGSHKD